MSKVIQVGLIFSLPLNGKAGIPSIENLDKLGMIVGAIEKAGGDDIQFSLNGPALNGANGNGRSAELGRNVLDDEAGEDRKAHSGKARDDADGSDGDDKPRRGRGRPRKSDAADAEARPASGRGKRGDAEGDDGEGAERDEPVGTRQGARKGADEGESRRGSSRGSGNAERGVDGAARISTGEDRGEQDDGWGDEDNAPAKDKSKVADNFDEDDPREIAARGKPGRWPDDLLPVGDITKDVIQTLLSEHFAASGGKDRQLTFDVMEAATGTRVLGRVPEDDYELLARHLMHDAARYEFGLVK